MSVKHMFVVGDRFINFTIGKNIITVSQLRGLLTISSMMIFQNSQMAFSPGQGLSDADISDILTLAKQSCHSQNFDFSALERRARRAPASQSHKHQVENTLISQPQRRSDHDYRLELLIDDKCELMRDHQTGQHLQGMLLLEAARQSFLAVSEAFFLPQDGPKFYFVIHEMTARYAHFAFPLDAQILYRIREKDVANPLRQHFIADIAIEQGGLVVASFVTDFTAFEDARISSREQSLAEKACDAATRALIQAPQRLVTVA